MLSWGGELGGRVGGASFSSIFYSIFGIRDFLFLRANAPQSKFLQKLKDTLLTKDGFAVKVTFTRA
jgi:hypothetical protein